jgi:hypothetical protein
MRIFSSGRSAPLSARSGLVWTRRIKNEVP